MACLPRFECFLRVCLLASLASFATGNEPASEGEKLFALKVKTLFAEKCMACHGLDPDDLGGGLDMRTRESLLRGGESKGSEVVVAGEGDASFLFVATTRSEAGMEMPPKESEQLSQEETWWIRDWIDAGAPWPDEDRVAAILTEYGEGEIVATSGGLSDDWSRRRYDPKHLWAYRPLKVESVPEGSHPIDWFLDRKLNQIGLAGAETAEPLQLARRICFGLTGLPPTPEQSRRFQAAMSDNPEHAVVDLAEQLMATPHYGEHFARQWLDVVRYADSSGFANDYARPNAWRYRDYVVRSFNQDKPYDEFVRQQIAGDEIDGRDSENMIATGFLRMGPWEQTSMSVFRVTRQQWIDDVTDSVGQTFLAHPLQCARCHDHKFDPIPTRDYYRMAAVFSTTQFAERDAPFLPSENQSGFHDALLWTKAKIKAYEDQRQELNDAVNKNRKKETGDAKVGDNGLSPGDEASLARINKNIARHTWEFDKIRPIAFCVYTGNTIERKNVGNRIKMPKDPWQQGTLEADTILTGGDPFTRGEEVTPGPLSAARILGGMKFGDVVTSNANSAEPGNVESFPAGQHSRRLALADWIVDETNPLTARVLVNRIWAWHFGKGLAANPNNFGATGSPPTHPELLDYLADWFMHHDWSIKKLNQLIVSSKAYRRSSRYGDRERLDQLDPGREAYAVFLPRRLTAEELRDAMLACSGELNQSLGGIPCRPDINMEVAIQPRQIMGGAASVYEPDPLPSQRNRRSIYAEKIRGLRDPFLESFNQPGPDKSCELRETSTVAPQALTLMNSVESLDRALSLAARLMRERQSDEQRLTLAFELVLGRPPRESERLACHARWRDAMREEELKQYDHTTYPSEIQRTVMAEKTGEPYDFIEIMPAYEHYVPDLQPGDVDVATVALAHVCLALFNLNEFAYLD